MNKEFAIARKLPDVNLEVENALDLQSASRAAAGAALIRIHARRHPRY
jgi:hypothetical protein